MNNTALITGASSGIGTALAKEFAENHYDLVLVARNKVAMEKIAQELQAKYHTKVLVIDQDLTAPNAASAIYQRTRQQGLTIDVLVNNAGAGYCQAFATTEISRVLGIIQLNIHALTELTHLFLQDMLAHKKGYILNVASTAAFQPGPNMAVYYASKAYVLSFSEALSYELKGQGVQVTTVCPGPTQTKFFDRANMNGILLVRGIFGMMSAEEVAKRALQGMFAGKRVVIPGFFNKCLAMTSRITPHALILWIVSRIQH